MSVNAFEPTVSTDRVSAADFYEEVARYDQEDTDLLWATALTCWNQQGVEYSLIDELEDGYEVRKPLWAKIEKINEGNYLATFEEGGIGISGEDSQDAYQSLVAEILDVFDALNDEAVLSPAAESQLEILQTYIVKAQPADRA